MVVAPYRADMVADLSFKMVGLLVDINHKMKVSHVPCRRDMVADLNYKMQAQPSRMTRCIRPGERQWTGERPAAGQGAAAGRRAAAGRGAAAGLGRSILYKLLSAFEVSFKE